MTTLMLLAACALCALLHGTSRRLAQERSGALLGTLAAVAGNATVAPAIVRDLRQG